MERSKCVLLNGVGLQLKAVHVCRMSWPIFIDSSIEVSGGAGQPLQLDGLVRDGDGLKKAGA